MLYLANASSPTVRAAMVAGELGQMCTPRERRAPLAGVTWAADNGCFATGYPGDAGWLAWLERHAPLAGACLFATAPDVLGDAAATLARSLPLMPAARARGYRPALVAQDGLTVQATPWDAFDWLFVGGTTAWKLGPQARDLVAAAHRHGKPVHMGRVNSGRRWRYAANLGCATADGTFLAFGPDANLVRLRGWYAAQTAAGAPT